MKMLHKSFHPVLPILKGLKFYNTYKELLPDLYIPEICQRTRNDTWQLPWRQDMV